MQRAIRGAYDALSAALLAVCVVATTATPAWAYVDPSVMTYTIQALAGVAVALSAVLGVVLRRTRKALLKRLDIDENANKPVEPPVSRIAEPAQAPQNIDYVIPGSKIPGGDLASPGKIRFPKRLGAGLLMGAFFVITAFCAPALELASANANDLIFQFDSLWPLILKASLAAWVILALILAVLPGAAFRMACCLVFAGGLCMYVQALFLNAGLPAADGTPVDWWGSFAGQMIASAIVWAVIIAAVLIFTIKAKGLAIRVFALLCAALVIIQGAGMASLFVNTSPSAAGLEGPSVVTEDGLFEISGKNNVIVIVLDKFDTRRLSMILEDNPHLLDEFTGFTWYQDSVGTMLPTAFALPYLLTGSTPTDKADTAYYRNRYINSTFLQSVNDAGYHVGVYSTGIGLGYFTNDEVSAYLSPMIDNIHPLGNVTPDAVNTPKTLLKCSLYRNLPWVAKGRFRYYTDDLNRAMLSTTGAANDAAQPYITDDPAYAKKLDDRGLTINGSYDAGSFRFIHLNGAHDPYTMDENAQAAGSTAIEQQATGAIGIANRYLRQLKELGAYEDATIVVMADHGEWAAQNHLPDYVTTPLLLYKPAGSSQGSVQTSMAQVSQEDLIPTLLSAMGIANQGSTFEDAPLTGRDRLTFQVRMVNDAVATGLFEYRIQGDVRNLDSWVYTGREIPCTDYTTSWKENAADSPKDNG